MDMDKTVLDVLHEYKKYRMMWTRDQTKAQKTMEKNYWHYLFDKVTQQSLDEWMNENAPNWKEIN